MTKAEYLEDLASRRKVVQLLLTSSFGALFLSVAYPILRYLVPPTIGEPRVASVEVPWTAAELKPNSGRIFRFGSRPGILIKTPGGSSAPSPPSAPTWPAPCSTGRTCR